MNEAVKMRWMLITERAEYYEDQGLLAKLRDDWFVWMPMDNVWFALKEEPDLIEKVKVAKLKKLAAPHVTINRDSRIATVDHFGNGMCLYVEDLL